MKVEIRDLWIHGTAEGETVVVVDVCRATTSIILALERGAREVIVVPTREEAFKLHSRNPGSLLMGEENGRPIPGFHLWNSPYQISRANLEGKTIVMKSTNGTRALLSARGERVLVASFPNVCAVAEAVRNSTEVIVFTASREDGDAVEDYLCAGVLQNLILERPVDMSLVRESIEKSSTADRLRTLGAEKDMSYCLSFCTTTTVPLCEKYGDYARCVIPR